MPGADAPATRAGFLSDFGFENWSPHSAESFELAIGIVEKLLQAGSQVWRQFRGPGVIDQAHADKIEQMYSVFQSKGSELHPHNGEQ